MVAKRPLFTIVAINRSDAKHGGETMFRDALDVVPVKPDDPIYDIATLYLF
jgi:hypothetical protein